MRTILQDVDRVMASMPYKTWAAQHTIDAGKVRKERAGVQRPLPNDSYGRTLVEAIRRGHEAEAPIPTPDPPLPKPPPGAVLVAPRTYNYAPSNNSDPRFCVHGQPGVVQRPDGMWTDESGAVYDSDGRDTSGIRSRLTQVPGLRQADNSDGRGECELYDGLTAWPGDPTKNTGSWQI